MTLIKPALPLVQQLLALLEVLGLVVLIRAAPVNALLGTGQVLIAALNRLLCLQPNILGFLARYTENALRLAFGRHAPLSDFGIGRGDHLGHTRPHDGAHDERGHNRPHHNAYQQAYP